MNQEPWLTIGILKSTKHKNKLFRKLVKCNFNDKELYIKYKCYRNKLTHIIQAAKQQHYQKILIKSKNDSKGTWNVINDLIGKNKKPTNLPKELQVDNKTIQDPKR